MKPGNILTLVWISTVAAWDPEDREIFELQDALATINSTHTFYSLLEVQPEATGSEIQKAYRKQSLVLHPDKNQDKPDAEALYKVLTSVQKILKVCIRESVHSHYYIKLLHL